jgi:RHS repeat-associated protein
MEYDAANKLVRRTDPMNHAEVLTYDSAGRLAAHQDAKGNTRQLTYDAAGRLTSIRFSNGQETTFSYDANGNRTGMIDQQGAAQWIYDAMNRVMSYTYNGKTVSYTYDVNGNRNSLAYPDGKTVQYSFNSLDRLDTVKDWLGRTTVYQYDAEERLTRVKNPNGSLACFETGPTGQLTSLRNVLADGAVISSQAFTLDPRGNVLLESGASPLNQVKTPQEKAYVYDQSNRLLTVGTTSYEYDDNGSLTKKVNGTATSDFAYDVASRLSEIKSADKTVQHLYDGLGNRTARIENGQRTNYILDLNSQMTQILAETDAGGNITKYHVYGLGLIETILPGGETQIYHFNSRGNTTAISNASGQIVQKYAYDDFGTVNNQWGNIESSFKFLGRFGVMADGDLYHIRARFYDPDIGRFITQDPMTGNQRNPQTLNRYVYALNNPIRFIDVTGYSSIQASRMLEKNRGTSDKEHKIFTENEIDLISGYLSKVVTEGAQHYAQEFAKQLEASSAEYGPVQILGRWSLDSEALGYLLKHGFDFITLASLINTAASELRKNWDDPGLDWTEKWGKASMSLTVHATLSTVNALFPAAIPVTALAGTAFDNNIDGLWNSLSQSWAVDQMGDLIYNNFMKTGEGN